MTMHHFRAQSGPFTSNIFFFRKPVNEPCFFYHVYLHTKNQSHILIYRWNTDGLRILKSHWLRAIFAFTWELDFSQACSFLRMLMNHKNFCFTQIPDKTNDIIFLRSLKTMFLGHFWPFLPDGNFFQKMQLCHTQLYMDP